MDPHLFQMRSQYKDQNVHHTDPRSCHRLLCAIFPQHPESISKRPFLWRRFEQTGAIAVLADYPPKRMPYNYEIDDPKPFTPDLRPGDRLGFTLRANPVVRSRVPRKGREGTKKVHHDVVMYAMWRQEQGQVKLGKTEIIREEGFKWIDRRSEESGFSIDAEDVQIDGYQQVEIKGKKDRGVRGYNVSTIDYDGILTVQDP